jgi:hypothetical protein
MKVKLNLPEMLSASNAGTIRQYASDQRGSEYSEGFTGEKMTPLTSHIEGAMGEVCVAKALGIHFPGSINTYGKADLGDDIGVRTTNREDYGLLIYPKDDPGYFYYLVKGCSPNYRVCGWIRGADAKQDRYLAPYVNNRITVWRVPESDLNPMTMEPPRSKSHDATA